MKKRRAFAPNLSESERALFREAMQGVKPLSSSTVLSTDKIGVRNRVCPRKLNITALRAEETFSLVMSSELSAVGSTECLSFTRGGVQEKVRKALRRGDLPITAYLDLHGSTVVEAQSRLFQFLEHAVHTGARCVRIIHGKSSRQGNTPPILKNKVNQWLQTYPSVLAFYSAPVRQGGVGAVNVLLKSRGKLFDR